MTGCSVKAIQRVTDNLKCTLFPMTDLSLQRNIHRIIVVSIYGIIIRTAPTISSFILPLHTSSNCRVPVSFALV